MSLASTILSATFQALQSQREMQSGNLALMNADGSDGTKTSFTTSVTAGFGGSFVTGVTATTTNTADIHGAIYSDKTMPNSNFAITGNGYAIVRDPKGNVVYTRLTDFTQQADGTYANSAGNKLMGMKFNPDGTLPTGGAILNNLQLIQINTDNSIPVPTSNVGVNMRIPPNPALGQNPTFETQIYGSLGIVHTLTCTFAKTGTNAWTVTPAITGGNITAPVAPIPITFNNNGTLATVNGNPTGTAVLTFDFSAGGESNVQNINLNLGTPGISNGLMQVGAFVVTYGITPDGAPVNDALTNTFNAQGVVSTVFKNSTRPQEQFQIVLANFMDPNALDNGDGTTKLQTLASGPPSFQVPGQGNVGVLAPQSLMQSNVDSTAQLVDVMGTSTTASLVLAALSQSIEGDKEFAKRM